MTDRTVRYRLEAEIGQFKAQMAAAGASVSDAANKMTAATKQGAAFRQGLDSTGRTAGKFALVAAAGLGAAVLKAADFDQSMSKVQAATHETAAAMDDLRQAALDAGADTAFSATEAAAGIENLAKAGVSTAEILDGGLAGALSLAAAGEMEVADAAEAAAGAMAQFGLSGDQVPHVADLLSAAAGKAAGDVSDFTMALKQGGTVAAQTGLSLEETTAALAAMAEQSLLGSDAGTSFKQFLSSLTPNSEKAANAMEAYNIQAFDAQGNFVGMTALAGQLQAGLGGLTNEQRAMTLETIFGSDAVRAASIIYDNGADGIADWTEKVNDAGFAAETAAIKQDNLRGDLEKLGGALETALIGTGSSSQGPLRSLTQSLEDAVNAYNDLGEGAKAGVTTALAATVAMGGGLFVFSKMVQSVAATRVAMTQLGISANVTQAQMLGFAKGASGVLLAAGAVAALGNAIAKANGAAINSSDLQRNIEALSLGNGDATLDRVISDLEIVNMLSSDLSEPIKELATGFGLLGNTNLDNAKDNLAQMDDALAGLVESGNADKAAIVFERIMAASDLNPAEVTEYFGSYETALENAGAAAKGSASSTQFAVDASGRLVQVTTGLTAATTDYEYAASEAGGAVESFKDKLERLNAALSGRAGLRDYQASLDDFTKSLKDNGRTFDINTEKGRANQAALDNIAGSALAVAGTMRGAARQKFLTNAIDDIRTMGENMGLPKTEIKALIALLVEANKKDVKPKVDVDTAPAFASFRAIDQWMTDLDGKRATTYVDTVRTVTGPQGGAAFSQKAAGGPIYGPGTPTSDSIPAMLSNGEYVIKAAAVSHYGVGTFDRLNAMHLAGGGSADKKRKRSGGLDPAGPLETPAQAKARELAEAKAAQAAVDAGEAATRAANAAAFMAEQAADFLSGQEKATQEWLKAAEVQLTAAESMRDGIAAQMEATGKASTAGFQSDLFGDSGGIWGAAGAGPLGALGSDIAGLTLRGELQAQLAAAGLDGDALAAALTQGSNQDLGALLASGTVQQFEDMFNERARLTGTVGAAAGEAAYGVEFARVNAEVTMLTANLDQLNAALAAINAQQNPTSAAAAEGYRQQGAVLAGAVSSAIVNGGNTVARRGTGGY